MSARPAESVAVLIARVAARWTAIGDELTALATRMREEAGKDTFDRLATGAQDALRALRAAVQELEHSSRHPSVVIATTGTTNAGKSTLANLLAGAELLPASVQEMSAGIVTIHHDPVLRRLQVEPTRGAAWETGTSDEISAEDVRSRLELIMTRYRDTLGEDATRLRADLEPPRFQIWWPTRVGTHTTALGLPSGARLQLVDLPGLKHVGDELTSPTIREQVKRALCLVAYDSQEPDRGKQGALLMQVVEQVKRLRGSPARMLFVLNKVDVFQRNRDPQESELRFRDSITRQIRSSLAERLPEYAPEIMAIEPVPLSSEPALLALLAEDTTKAGERAIHRLTGHYAFLFQDSATEPLPLLPRSWSESQRRWLIGEVKYRSRLEAFEKRLGEHIAAHLPELLVPDLVESAFQACRSLLEQLDAFATAQQRESVEQVRHAMERLEMAYAKLTALHEEAQRTLEPFRRLKTERPTDLLAHIHDATRQIERVLGLAAPELQGDSGPLGPLAPLATAHFCIAQEPLQKLNDYVYTLARGDSCSDHPLDSMPELAPLRAAVETLRSGPYGRASTSDTSRLTFEASEADEVALALEALAVALSDASETIIKRAADVHADRMQGALVKCGEAVMARLSERARTSLNELGNEFSALRTTFQRRVIIRKPILPKPQCRFGLERWTTTTQVLVEEPYVERARRWYFLWLVERDVVRQRTKTVTEERRGVNVLGLGQLLEAFTAEILATDLDTYVVEWLSDSLESFQSTIQKQLESSRAAYQSILEDRGAELERGAATVARSTAQHTSAIGAALATIETAREWREHR